MSNGEIVNINVLAKTGLNISDQPFAITLLGMSVSCVRGTSCNCLLYKHKNNCLCILRDTSLSEDLLKFKENFSSSSHIGGPRYLQWFATLISHNVLYNIK